MRMKIFTCAAFAACALFGGEVELKRGCPELSPNDITPGEATLRRAVAEVPVHAGVAARRRFPAWRLQRQDHLARLFRLLVRATCAIPILPAPDAPHGS